MFPDKSLDHYISVVSLMSGECFTVLELFSETSLRETRYVKITQLEDIFKYAPRSRFCAVVPLYYFKDDGDDGKRFTFDRVSQLSFDDILKDCPEIQLFCRKYFPELVL